MIDTAPTSAKAEGSMIDGQIKTGSRDPRDGELAKESKGQASLRWSGDEAESRRLLDEQTHHYFQWTSVTVVAAVIVSLIIFSLTFLH